MTNDSIASGRTSIPELIAEAKNGRMIILVDSESEHGIGNMVIPAQFTTPESVNFMARVGRGLVSLAITKAHAEHLGLPMLAARGATASQEECAVSIEAREGVTTGISAGDRARTIAAAIDFGAGRDGLTTPGHVFPIIASTGGVLERPRRAEAGVDIARLAGLNPSSVVCEILNSEGMIASLADIREIARQHDLKYGTIRDLVAYRREHDREVDNIDEGDFDSLYGGRWRVIVFRNRARGSETLVLTKGDVADGEPLLVRMHRHGFLADSLGEIGGREGLLRTSMEMIAEEGRGVIVLINKYSPTYYSEAMLARAADGATAKVSDFRDYGGGAQILTELGVQNIILLSNRHTSSLALDDYGLKVVAVRAIRAAS